MSRAVAYIRKSSAPTAGSVSFDMQARAVEELAQRHGDEGVEILSDLAVSGGTTRRRPQYGELMRRIEASEVSTLYSFALSRLSRSVVDFADLLDKCRNHGVTVRLVQEGQIDYTTATGRGFANMAATFAQMEREIAAERLTAAAAERRERGDVMGQAPYGYRIDKGELVRRPDEPLEAVFAAFSAAGTFGGTARLLNHQRVPTRHGRPWTHGVVSDVLRRMAPPELGVPRSAVRAGAPARATTIFGGLLRCPCGAILTPRKDAANATGASGYYCSRSYRMPSHGRMHTPERQIIEWAQVEAARLDVPADVLESDERDEQARHRIEARRGRVIEAFIDQVIDKAERDRRLRSLDAELNALEAQRTVTRIPSTVDWNWSPKVLNAVLTALWGEVRLDADLRPVQAVWRVPEWRS